MNECKVKYNIWGLLAAIAAGFTVFYGGCDFCCYELGLYKYHYWYTPILLILSGGLFFLLLFKYGAKTTDGTSFWQIFKEDFIAACVRCTKTTKQTCIFALCVAVWLGILALFFYNGDIIPYNGGFNYVIQFYGWLWLAAGIFLLVGDSDKKITNETIEHVGNDNLQANEIRAVGYVICMGATIPLIVILDKCLDDYSDILMWGAMAMLLALGVIPSYGKFLYKTKDGSDVGEALKDMRRSTWKNMEPWLIGLGVIFGWIGIGVALLYIGYRMDEGGWVQFGGLLWLALGWMLFRSGGRF